jgi:hypothetical protein
MGQLSNGDFINNLSVTMGFNTINKFDDQYFADGVGGY